MKRILDNIKALGVVALFLAFIFGIAWLKFKMFQVNHPGAPWWGWIFN